MGFPTRCGHFEWNPRYNKRQEVDRYQRDKTTKTRRPVGVFLCGTDAMEIRRSRGGVNGSDDNDAGSVTLNRNATKTNNILTIKAKALALGIWI